MRNEIGEREAVESMQTGSIEWTVGDAACGIDCGVSWEVKLRGNGNIELREKVRLFRLNIFCVDPKLNSRIHRMYRRSRSLSTLSS